MHCFQRAETAIVKNTPTTNARLYKIKHLIEITPISMPYGMPENAENGFLKENGEFVACNSLQEGNQLQLEESKVEKENLMKKSVDGETLKKRLHLNWYQRYL